MHPCKLELYLRPVYCITMYTSLSKLNNCIITEYIVLTLPTAGKGESALSVSAFYGWLDFVKHLVETVGLDPKGETVAQENVFSIHSYRKALLICFMFT